MGKLERVRDTTQKKTLRVWVEGLKNPLQVWTDGEEFYVYACSQWMTLNTGDLAIYGPVRKEPDETDRVGTYKTNVPTNLGTLEDGFSATYTFYDYDETTVLKTGTVVDGGTPTAPTDPTREATAQYTYTFAGREPEVGPITKNTDYTATYTATVNQYTATIGSNNTEYGTVDVASVTANYGTEISATDNVLTIGDTEITATAETGYEFSSWGTLPETVTGDITITATFVAE